LKATSKHIQFSICRSVRNVSHKFKKNGLSGVLQKFLAMTQVSTECQPYSNKNKKWTGGKIINIRELMRQNCHKVQILKTDI
jgi:hypothetical protein